MADNIFRRAARRIAGFFTGKKKEEVKKFSISDATALQRVSGSNAKSAAMVTAKATGSMTVDEMKANLDFFANEFKNLASDVEKNGEALQEGPFRLPGSTGVINSLTSKPVTNISAALSEDHKASFESERVNNLTGAFKKTIRDLRDIGQLPVIPSAVKAELSTAKTANEVDKILERNKDLLPKSADGKKTLLDVVSDTFLIALHDDNNPLTSKTKMTSSNLAVVTSPNLDVDVRIADLILQARPLALAREAEAAKAVEASRDEGITASSRPSSPTPSQTSQTSQDSAISAKSTSPTTDEEEFPDFTNTPPEMNDEDYELPEFTKEAPPQAPDDEFTELANARARNQSPSPSPEPIDTTRLAPQQISMGRGGGRESTA